LEKHLYEKPFFRKEIRGPERQFVFLNVWEKVPQWSWEIKIEQGTREGDTQDT